MNNEYEITPIDHALLWFEDCKTDTDIACEQCINELDNEWDRAYLAKQRSFLNDYFSFLRKHLNDLKEFIDSKGIKRNE